MRRSPATLLALLLALAAAALPPAWAIAEAAAQADEDADPYATVADAAAVAVHWWQLWPAAALAAVVAASLILALARPHARGRVEALTLAPAVLAGAALPFLLLGRALAVGGGAWLLLAGALVALWRVLALLSRGDGPARHLLVPALFGAAVLYLWEVLVRGLDVPLILLPPPSAIAAALANDLPVLAGDFVQTVLRAALGGYLIGCGAGLAVAILCDRFPFLARGLLPYGNLMSAVPMIGIAPIMVMWFGFGWQSKAAVVAVVTFFPMLVNALAGLAASEPLQLDLMRSYAAGYGRTLLALRLPNALPFVFNALKLNSTLALIGAIVAEFFGTPIVGMGFRISTEVARMNLDVVWATIAVAALTGSAAYGGLALAERAVTAWHPSYRRR